MTRHDPGLFDLPPATRRGDPSTSRMAELAISLNSTRKTHCQRVLAAVKRRPGLTYVELARECGLERHEVMRRLSDLEHSGFVRKARKRCCTIQGTTMVTWEEIQ